MENSATIDRSDPVHGCHGSQFTAETLQRMLPAMSCVLNGKVGFIPAFPATSADDLFR
jgi:hypothetical protein